ERLMHLAIFPRRRRRAFGICSVVLLSALAVPALRPGVLYQVLCVRHTKVTLSKNGLRIHPAERQMLRRVVQARVDSRENFEQQPAKITTRPANEMTGHTFSSSPLTGSWQQLPCELHKVLVALRC